MLLKTPELIAKRYQLLEKIGEGGMGVVYRAADRLQGGQPVALKQVTVPAGDLAFASRLASDDFEDIGLALTREFKTLASLHHPHVIRVLDYGFTGKRQPFFTMELLDQPTTLVEAGQYAPFAAQIDLIMQTLQALVYLHRRQIIHRDLKPQNVLVADGQVKVTDFGLAVLYQDASHRVAGTLTYLAPELLQGQRVSVQSDLYAVGLMLYEILTGQYPFDKSTTHLLITDMLTREPDLSGIAPALASVLARLLAKLPSDRYANAGEVIAALSAATGQPVPPESVAVRESFLTAAGLVGREAELDQLEAALKAAMNGQGSAWLIGGESGVGKSRLVDELRTLALVRGVLVLRGQGVQGGGLPFQLWRDLLPRLLLTMDISDLEAARLKVLLPDLDTLIGRSTPEALPLADAAAVQALTRTLTSLLQQNTQPMLINLEDLQWVSESLDVIKALLPHIHNLPLLIVGTYRDDERVDLPTELPGMQVIKLRRLPAAAIADLSTQMLGEAGRQPQVISLLQRETEGNVFFLVEVVRALAEEAGRLDQIGSQPLPERVFAGGIQQLIARRLAQIPEVARPFFRLAAAAGRRLDQQVLKTALAASDEQIAQWLLIGASAAILETDEAQAWRFAHDKLREGVILAVPEAERQLLHQQVAEALETTYPDTDDQLEILLEQWSLAGNDRKEIHYLLKAAQLAQIRGRFPIVISYADRALTRLENYPEVLSERVNALFHKVYPNISLGNFPAAEEALMAARQAAHLSGEAKDQAAVLLGSGSLKLFSGRYLEGQQDLLAALPYFEAQHDPRHLLSLYNSLAGIYTMLGELEQGKDYAEKALSITRQLKARHTEITILNNLGYVSSSLGLHHQAIEYYQQAGKNARELEMQAAEPLVAVNTAREYFYLGEIERGFTLLDNAQTTAAQVQSRQMEIGSLYYRGIGLYLAGDYTNARANLEKATQTATAAGDLFNQVGALGWLGKTLYYLADPAAIETLQQSITLADKMGMPDFRHLNRRFLAEVYLLTGQPDLALATIEAALQIPHINHNHRSYLLRGVIQQRMGQPADFAPAIAEAHALLTHTPGMIDPLCTLAFLNQAEVSAIPPGLQRELDDMRGVNPSTV